MIDEVVPAALDGERADRVVTMVTGCTRKEAAELIGAGGLVRNDRPVRKVSERVAEGDVVRIDDSLFAGEVLPEADDTIPLTVVHEDEHLMVVDKPAGLVVHPGAGTPSGTLVNALLARYPEIAEVGESQRPGIVHRLDKGTSGLLMVARTEEAREDLADQLAARLVERIYITVVWGHVESDQGLIDASIGRSKRHPTRMVVAADGREARTRYEVLQRATEPTDVTVLHCRLETGRTHQIRVHCRAIGHTVVGDDLYDGRRDSIDFARPALHAAVLGFDHPVTGEELRFEADPPADLAALLASLND